MQRSSETIGTIAAALA
jgi:hypothetical protein